MALAYEHNFLIVEGKSSVVFLDNLFKTLLDDPYYYLYFGSVPRPPSYWELEGKLNNTRGRVLRFDSFSKVLSAGLRLGLVTGPKPIVDAINLHVSKCRIHAIIF